MKRQRLLPLAILTVVALSTLVPFVWTLSMSLKPDAI